MFQRTLFNELNIRISENDFEPVLLTGVRGCGKTTLGGQFAKRFAQMMLFDLSEPSDRKLFSDVRSRELQIHDLYRYRNRDPNGGRTLLFLDNLQDAEGVWEAVAGMPGRPQNLFVLGASDSVVGGRKKEDWSPQSAVGSTYHVPRTTSYVLRPSSFKEFLPACGEQEVLALYLETPSPDHAHRKLLALFHRYVQTGGMPAAVNAWAEERNMVKVEKVFDQLLGDWNRLVHDRVRTRKRGALASSVLADSFPYAAERIRFRNFANRPLGSRESAEIFRSLQDMQFLDLLYPLTGTGSGVQPDGERFPRLQFADTGMAVYFSGIRHPVADSDDLTKLVGGQVLRHVVGQEMVTRDENMSRSSSFVSHPSFWVSPNPQSHAEVDFVLPYNELLIPVVTRSGEPGQLRSLHSFLDRAPHNYAVRLCADRLNVRKTETIRGKTYYLLSMPYYLAARIPEHLEGFIRYTS